MKQIEFSLPAKPRGVHLITDEVVARLGKLPEVGLIHLMVKHTSCGLAINENYDPDVRHDLEIVLDELVPEGNRRFRHTMEGRDDMPSHAKSVISGVSLIIPITKKRLNLGTWQGLYLLECRNNGGARRFVATIIE